MTNVNDINVGDKIRATSKANGETVEGTATGVNGGMLGTKQFWLHHREWDFEVLERARVELPTKHLAMVGSSYNTPYVLINGVWFDLEPGYMPERIEESDIQKAVRFQGFRVVFEGVDD